MGMMSPLGDLQSKDIASTTCSTRAHHTDEIDDEHRDAVDSEPGVLLGGPEQEPSDEDDCQQSAEGGEVQVAVVCVRQNRLAADDRREQQQHRHEGVATEDVAEGELVVAAADRGPTGAS